MIPKIPKICEACDKPFEVHQCRRNTARYCSRKCAHRGSVMTLDDTLLNIQLNEPSTLDTGCWSYPKLPDSAGYIKSCMNRNQRQLHALVYEHFRGAIPEGMVCHHECRHKWCCNPDHITLKTPAEHNDEPGHAAEMHRSKTHCPHGHPYDLANTEFKRNGHRRCRTCRILEAKERQIEKHGILGHRPCDETKTQSGYQGVSIDPRQRTSPYRAKIQKDGTSIRLGRYSTAELAARQYDWVRLQLYGEGYYLNFPRKDYPSEI